MLTFFAKLNTFLNLNQQNKKISLLVLLCVVHALGGLAILR
jgi:hypothetical protein